MNEARATRRAELLDATAVAAEIKQEVTREAQQFLREHGVRPGLAAVRVGDDAASAVYVRNKIKACEEVGIRSEHLALPSSTSSVELLELIAVGSSRVDLQACKLEYSIVSPK